MILNCYYPSPLGQSGAAVSEIFISKQLFLSYSLRTYCLGSCDLSDQEHLIKGTMSTTFGTFSNLLRGVVYFHNVGLKNSIKQYLDVMAPMLNCSCWKAESVGTDKTQDTFLAVLHPPGPT